jgi:hypothetical protein
LLIGPAIYLTLYLTIGQGFGGWTIHWLHLAGLNAVLLTGFMLVAGQLTPRGVTTASVVVIAAPPAPWSRVGLASVAVVAAAVGVYALFWYWARPPA